MGWKELLKPNQLGTKVKVTAILAFISYFLQFISWPFIGDLATLLFGGLGGLFSLLTVIFIFQARNKNPGS